MRVLLLVLLTLLTTGCAGLRDRQLLGARVHSFTVGGKQLVHCSILMDKAKLQQAHDAIEVCRDELQAVPERK